MANRLGSVISAIRDVPTQRAVKAIGLDFQDLERTVSTLVRNNETVASHADLGDLDYASSGHTGFASSAAVAAVIADLAAHEADVANPHTTTLQQAIAAGATASSEPRFDGGIDMGSSGRFDSNVTNAASAVNFEFQPTSTLTSGTDRWLFRVRDAAGTTRFSIASNGTASFFDVEANGLLMHTGSQVGFYNIGPVARPTAYTQTYSTATRTHAAFTAATLTDSSGGTANTTVAAVSGSGDDTNINNNFADVTAQVNALIVDLANAKQVLNQVLDDFQLNGLLQ